VSFIDLNQPDRDRGSLYVEIKFAMAGIAGDFRFAMNMMAFVAGLGFSGRKVWRCMRIWNCIFCLVGKRRLIAVTTKADRVWRR
jgi:hypothetical protein